METGDDEITTGSRRARRRRLPSVVRRIVVLLLAALVIQYVVVPQLVRVWPGSEAISQVDPLLLLAGTLLQIAAYVSHAQLTRAVIPAEHRPGLLVMSQVEVASRAISHVVPGGTAAGTALFFRLLRQRGVPGSDAAFAAATQGIGSAIVLNVLLWLALVVSIPLRGFNPYYGLAALLGVALIGGFAVLVLLLVRADERTTELAGRVLEKVPFVRREAAERVAHRVAVRVQELMADPPLLRRATAWATVSWLFDAASLWVFLAAFGELLPGDALFVVFGLTNVVASIPITPRGLGAYELMSIPLLTWFGSPVGVATLAVLGYRLVSFWMPIPIGALAYLSFRVTTGAKAERRKEVLTEWVAEAAARAESVREWAVRTGLRSERDDR